MSESSIAETAWKAFGWDGLREGQQEAVAALLAGRDVIAVLPTGAGKSAVYQLAGTMLEGITVVVSPLIALQADQVNQLAEAPDAPRGVVVNSAISDGAAEDAWADLSRGTARFLFLAPEQLAKDAVRHRLHALGVALLVVDEAHCVASWGHDFRPDYLRLGAVRTDLGRPPTVAMTATGAEPVRREIAERLGLEEPVLIVRGVDRPNIDLTVVRATSENDKREAILGMLPALDRPGLVYTATRRETAEYAEALRERGLRTEPYHAGLAAGERSRVHQAFLGDDLDVVVATNAFGMGIDKPNVRFVVHASVPESLDAYYQEIGRAGRDGDPASATLFYRAEDLGLRRYFAARRADADRLALAYQEIAGAEAPVRIKRIADALDVSLRAATGIVNLLVEGGAVRMTRRGAVALAQLGAREAASAAEEAAERRERIERSRLDVMRRYAETRDCRRRLLLGYFGDELADPCGACDSCRDGTAEERAAHESAGAGAPRPYPAGALVEHVEWGRGSVVDVEEDRVTVFFDEQGYKVLALAAVSENALLSRVG